MELGYTAVAYDRPFRGVLSDADRCPIAPFPALLFLESGTGASVPAFTASVALHRELLSVPRAAPFRQYTRITVSVDSAAASLLNSGNRLLRSYDIVATRPVNQVAFDQACNASEVDIISLNFSQKLPYRLKLPMVQAAIKRGVHFEISYSHIIADGHARRQILSEAKRLVEWTRGKNLIISSSATNLNEVRGPYDVANLSTVLLGLTMERAKSAISKNCRSLVVNALRKKDCYFKEAIRIERILPEGKVDSQGNWFKDWNEWDPLSTGAHEIPPLEDIAKLFSTASTHSKSEDTVDLASSINGLASNAPLVPCSNKHRLDHANAIRSSSEVEHSTVDHVSVETSAIVANPLSNAANCESEPCSHESGMAIDAFECTGTPISGINLSLTDINPFDVYGSVENTDPAKKYVDDLLDCSSVGARDRISMSDDELIITTKNHCLQKCSSIDAHYDDNTDIVEVRDQLLLRHETRTTSNNLDEMGLQEQLAVQFQTSIFDDALENQHGSTAEVKSTFGIEMETVIFDDAPVESVLEYQQGSTAEVKSTFGNEMETSIFDDAPVKMELEIQKGSTAEVKSTFGNEMETQAQAQTSILSKNTCPNGFAEGELLCISTAEILENPTLSRTKKLNPSPENSFPLIKDIIEAQQSVQRLIGADGVDNRFRHKSGKHGRFRGRSNQRGYLLSLKNFCKSMLFKKKRRRLSRATQVSL